MRFWTAFVLTIIVAINAGSMKEVHGGDWPMWRYDAGRTAASPEILPDEVQLLWTRTFSPRKQAWDDPLNLDLMTYDRVFEPIVMGGRLYVGFNDRDALSAFNADTGEELWTFFTDGPVRLPPAGGEGGIYFCSDDGSLYCVDATSGELQWQFRGAPHAQHAIGNQRLTSAWPARGGTVVRDGTVYYAASIWPFMGTFIYALDAESGEVKWVNDSTGSQYIKQPHSAPSFAGVAPQGALVATEEYLLVPGGRSVPAAFDRASGEFRYFEINAGGKGTGGSFVVANESHFFVHTRGKGVREFEIQKGVKTAFMPNEPVLADETVYSAEWDDDQPVVKAYGSDRKPLWEVSADGRGDLIRAGDHLYAAGPEAITAIRLPQKLADDPQVTWTLPVEGSVERLLAADGKLFAVTLDGSVLAFGQRAPVDPPVLTRTPLPLQLNDDQTQQVGDLLRLGTAEGYAFWYGAASSDLVKALAADSPFVQLAIVDEDPQRVRRLRQDLDNAGLYGLVTVHASAPEAFAAPKYVAHMVFVGPEVAQSAGDELIAELYRSVRPYGGVLVLLAEETDGNRIAEQVAGIGLEQAKIDVTPQGVIVRRVGALPGSADWTHQYGDIANTIKSNDQRVKLPLGVLWFGGSSNLDVLPRHGHGPPEQVVGGRLFIQGHNCVSARDVYTGRVLWKREFDDLGTFDVYYDETYEDTPLNPQYNQVHIPGANGRGTNYVVTEEGVYLVEGNVCHVLDPATGETLRDIELPETASQSPEQWGFIGVYEDVLIGGFGFADYRDRHELTFESDAQLKKNRAGFGSKSLDRAASQGLVGFNRHTGEQLWTIEANHSFWHNGIVAGGGRIYCLDRNPEQVDDALRRRGRARPDNYRIAAFDAGTGAPLWEITKEIFGTWLGYSAEHDLLLQAGAAASDRLYGEVGQGMAVYSGSDGTLRWQKDSLKYAGPCILHNDLILTNTNSYSESAGAYRITDGEQKLVPNPLTGELQPWKITRAYGCNSIIASEHLLTFRSGAAGFYDLLSDSGTGNFGGFKSGCTSNLVVANGVLNAPDYTRTCSCAYQNQTSLALVHMPDIDVWTVHAAVAAETDGQQVRQLGINLGAPGDRRDAEGRLWIESPAVAGDASPITIDVDAQANFFRHHSSSMAGNDYAWVLSSGVEGASEIRIGLMPDGEDALSTGLPISHADDDAEESESGEVSLGSSDLELIEDSGTQLVGMRFEGINLPRGAKIRQSSLQFTCDEPSDKPTALIIRIEDSGNAVRFRNDSHDLSSRPFAQPEVAWRPPAWNKPGEAGEAQRSPDLAPLIQSVIDRPDWQPGNSLAIFISGTGKRVATASRGETGNPTRLIIEAEEDTHQEASGKSLQPYRVRLLFGAPPALGAEQRVFHVDIQGERVLEGLTLDPAGPLSSRFVIHEMDSIMIGDELVIRLVPLQGKTILSGIALERIISE